MLANDRSMVATDRRILLLKPGRQVYSPLKALLLR
jgi:hypothetical protein